MPVGDVQAKVAHPVGAVGTLRAGERLLSGMDHKMVLQILVLVATGEGA